MSIDKSKVRVFNGDHLVFLCACGDHMPAYRYPVDLKFDTVEVICTNEKCVQYNKIIAVRLQPAEVVYVKDNTEQL